MTKRREKRKNEICGEQGQDLLVTGSDLKIPKTSERHRPMSSPETLLLGHGSQVPFTSTLALKFICCAVGPSELGPYVNISISAFWFPTKPISATALGT